jgi:L-ascorbate metabolism protein UlaG (beta-lactamase superfamily)
MSFLTGTVIQWIGHACFLITTVAGAHILIDPVNPKVGYPVTAHSVQADLIFVTHNHFDHNWLDLAVNQSNVVKPMEHPGYEDGYFDYQPGAEKHRINFRSIFSYHDNNEGKDRGNNTIYVIDVDGLRICHMGDLGQNELTKKQLELIGKVDVLMIPVGGFYTIDSKTAAHIANELHAKWVFPMHYSNDFLEPDLKAKLAPVSHFLDDIKANADINAGADTIALSPKRMPRRMEVIVLEPSKLPKQ